MPQAADGQSHANEETASSVEQAPATANEFVERELHRALGAVEQAFDSHALTFSGPLMMGVDDILRSAVEARHKSGPAKDRLVVLLTTGGGYLEPVQRMVSTLRRHYTTVDFVIPNYAYSAGTVFALSGDAIHMDYYSRLGPIDPQMPTSRSGRLVSALGILEKYNELIEKAQSGKISNAEVQLLIEGFDQAELYNIEHARELSIATLEEWLVNYKFKNWIVTEGQGAMVTLEMKKARASDIGKQLNDTKRWHSHGYGISMEVLRRDLKLIIDDFEQDSAVCSAVRYYHSLLADYMAKRGMQAVVHVANRYLPII